MTILKQLKKWREQAIDGIAREAESGVAYGTVYYWRRGYAEGLDAAMDLIKEADPLRLRERIIRWLS